MFVLLVAVFSSCDKAIENSIDIQNENLQKNDEVPPMLFTQFFYDELTLCGEPAINCASPVIITPGKGSDVLDEIFSNAKTLQQYFLSDEWETKFPFFKEKKYSLVMDKLKSGEYIAKIKINKENNTIYYLFGREDDFSEEHPEFVIPVIEK